MQRGPLQCIVPTRIKFRVDRSETSHGPSRTFPTWDAASIFYIRVFQQTTTPARAARLALAHNLAHTMHMTCMCTINAALRADCNCLQSPAHASPFIAHSTQITGVYRPPGKSLLSHTLQSHRLQVHPFSLCLFWPSGLILLLAGNYLLSPT